MRPFRTFAVALIVAGLSWAQASAASCVPGAPAPAPCPPAVPAVVPVALVNCPPPPPPLPAQAQFFGSEDYFQAHDGTPQGLVTGLYGDVLGRAPTQAEMDRWVSRWGTSGNGVNLAREFLISAQSELAARAAAAPPPAPPTVVLVPVAPPCPAPACPPA